MPSIAATPPKCTQKKTRTDTKGPRDQNRGRGGGEGQEEGGWEGESLRQERITLAGELVPALHQLMLLLRLELVHSWRVHYCSIAQSGLRSKVVVVIVVVVVVG